MVVSIPWVLVLEPRARNLFVLLIDCEAVVLEVPLELVSKQKA